MADRDHDSSSLEPGVGKSAAVIGGVGLASAGAAVAAGVQVQNIIEAAREAAIQALTQHQHSLAEDGVARVGGTADEQTARLETLASELDARMATALTDLATGLQQQISENIERLATHMTDQLNSTFHGGQKDLHRLAQELESDIIEQRDRAIAEIREEGQRAVELVQHQADSIRTEAQRLASAASAEIDSRITHLDSKVTNAIESIHQTADSRVAEMHDFNGSFRVDRGSNPEDDFQIG
ncbi:MAG TPA: hypothetical protein PLC24_06090 [Myxococcota bacterium]|nr:hypothetical protein [Myxococcota bacterium]